MRDVIGRSRRLFGSVGAALLAAVGVLAATPSVGRADIILSVQDSTAPVGGSGSFDVLLTNTGGSFDVAALSLQLSAPTNSGITFTLVDTNTLSAPYLFGTLQAPPFSFDTFPNTQFTASDTDFTAPGFVTSTPGSVFGLAHVNYSVAPGTSSGAYTISLLDVGGGTSLSDPNGDAIAFTPSNGTITVQPQVNTVPEPTSLVIMLTGLGTYSVTRLLPRLNRRIKGRGTEVGV